MGRGGSSAQRLTAIRGKSRQPLRSSLSPRRSAQRLTAIRGKSRRGGRTLSITQPCSTPYGNQRKITHFPGQYLPCVFGVLNALRQSEENHWYTSVGYRLNGSCSTPYGNQRKITQYTEGSIAFGRVCSTPYGNQRKITRFAEKLHPQFLLCSTPYGNQRKITLGLPLQPHGKLVLNALRQSEENHLGEERFCLPR